MMRIKLILFLLVFLYHNTFGSLLFKIDLNELKTIYTIDVTVYNPEPSQCNADYLHTADMSFIDTTRINELMWVAISRDLLEDINYGDTIIIFNNDTIANEWIVHDCMNARFNNRVDLLQSKKGLYGKWSNIKFYKK